MMDEREAGLHGKLSEEIENILDHPDAYPQLGSFERDQDSVIYKGDAGPLPSLVVSPGTITYKNGNQHLRLSLAVEDEIPIAYLVGGIRDQTRERITEVMGTYAFGSYRYYPEIPDIESNLHSLYIGQKHEEGNFDHENFTTLYLNNSRKPGLYHGNVAGRNVVAVHVPDVGAMTRVNVSTYEKKVFDPYMEIESLVGTVPIKPFSGFSVFSRSEISSWPKSLEFDLQIPLGIGESFVRTALIGQYVKAAGLE